MACRRGGRRGRGEVGGEGRGGERGEVGGEGRGGERVGREGGEGRGGWRGRRGEVGGERGWIRGDCRKGNSVVKLWRPLA